VPGRGTRGIVGSASAAADEQDEQQGVRWRHGGLTIAEAGYELQARPHIFGQATQSVPADVSEATAGAQPATVRTPAMGRVAVSSRRDVAVRRPGG
jgi:hypothetical protein